VTACGIFNDVIFFLRECNRDFYHVCIVFHGVKAKYYFGCAYDSEIYPLVNYKNE
jgi:hypothetical protein